MILPRWAVRATDAGFFLGKVPLNFLISVGCGTKFFAGLKLPACKDFVKCRVRLRTSVNVRVPDEAFLGSPGRRGGERAEAHLACRPYVEAFEPIERAQECAARARAARIRVRVDHDDRGQGLASISRQGVLVQVSAGLIAQVPVKGLFARRSSRKSSH